MTTCLFCTHIIGCSRDRYACLCHRMEEFNVPTSKTCFRLISAKHYKLHHSSLYALKFIHTYESVDISHVDAQLTVQKLEQFQKSRSQDQPAQKVKITLLTPRIWSPSTPMPFYIYTNQPQVLVMPKPFRRHLKHT